MEFKNLDEIKEFLRWCKKEKIQEVKLGDMIFAFSPSVMLMEHSFGDMETNMHANSDITNQLSENPEVSEYDGPDLSIPPKSKRLQTPQDEEDELLFWSTNEVTPGNKET